MIKICLKRILIDWNSSISRPYYIIIIIACIKLELGQGSIQKKRQRVEMWALVFFFVSQLAQEILSKVNDAGYK